MRSSPDGLRVEGVFKDGIVSSGLTTIFYAFNDEEGRNSYKGCTQNEIPDGKGVLTWLNGKKYEGTFANGVFDGEGIMNYPRDDSKLQYKGGFKRGYQHGRGILTWRDGTVYAGVWLKDMMHGGGKLTQASGAYYEG